MAVKGPNHQMRTRIRGLTVLFALIGFGLVGVRLLYMPVSYTHLTLPTKA